MKSVKDPAPVLVTTLGGNVFGLDPETGRVLWEQELDQAGNAAALVVTERYIYVATFSYLACLRMPTGEQVWLVETSERGRATLLLEGNRLYVGKRGELECFTLSGERVWHNPFKGKGQGDMALGVPGNVAQADG